MEDAGAWLARVEAGECDLPLDELISSGAKHLFILETCASCVGSSDSSHQLSVSKCMDPIANWIGRWEAAAVEAESLGLGRDISYKYWQKNIELPEVFTRATKWFVTAQKLAEAVDTQRLRKFITDGERHADAVEACWSSWPQARRLSIEQCVVEWHVLLSQWLQVVFPNRADLPTKEPISQQLKKRSHDGLNGPAGMYEEMKKERRARRADMRKKRTCSYCGKTGPPSQVSFAYCGGCRHSRVARVHWTRYCSEACQRAHWHASHKDECPCAKDL